MSCIFTTTDILNKTTYTIPNMQNTFTPNQMVQVTKDLPSAKTGITYTVAEVAGDMVTLCGTDIPLHVSNLRPATEEEQRNAKVIIAEYKRLVYYEDTIQVQFKPGISAPIFTTVLSAQKLPNVGTRGPTTITQLVDHPIYPSSGE